MIIQNIFSQEVTDELIGRIGKLTPESQPLWGKMNVAQMLAHCCVSYELVYEMDRFPKPGKMMKFIIQLLANSRSLEKNPIRKMEGQRPYL